MPFVPFHDYFPEIAERETQSITVFPHDPLGLPAGEYGFLELYCDEPGCDCRRVFFYVLCPSREEVQAVIAWGWESVDFYMRWFKYGDHADAVKLKGPVLNSGSPATELAPGLLELVRNVLLTDPEYAERIKRHYTMVRERIDRPRKPGKRRPRMHR